MKKVLSFVLVLSMILGSFSMAFAAPVDVVGTEYEDAANVLVELGVIGGYKDGTFRPENIVTRAEMATMIVKALGLNDYAVGKSSFTDMAGHWADAYVAYAVSLGFIAGYSDGTFKPDAPVTADQGITMLVQAVGYKGEFLTGGYPGAFVNQAKALGMLDGVKAGAAGMNRGAVATLIFNTLDVEFVRYDKDGATEETIPGGEDMLDRLGAGTFVPVDSIVSGAAAGLEADEFIVKGTEDAVINIKEYQGAMVEAYGNDGDIIAIKEVKSVFISGDYNDDHTFTTNDDVDYDFRNVTSTSAIYAHFENGEYVGATSLGAITTPEGLTLAVKLSGKYITEVYSVAEWTDGVDVRVDEDDLEDLEDDKFDNEDFTMNDDKEIDMDELVLVGVESLDEIKEDDIVTYYLGGTSGKIVKMEVSDATVDGIVSKVDSQAATSEVTIGGKTYDLGTAVAGGELPSLKSEGTFFLNYAGDIVDFDGVSKTDNYAMVVYAKGTAAGEYAAESINKIKLLTADDKETVFTFEEDYNPAGFTTTGMAVRYTLNKSGEIDFITEAAMNVTTVGMKLTAKGYLDGYKVADGVVVFEVDYTAAETVSTGGVYESVGLSAVPVNEDLVSTTALKNSKGEIVVILLDKAAVETADGIYGVVTDSYEEYIAEDDEEVMKVVMLVDGKEVTYTVKSSYEATAATTVSNGATSLFAITLSNGELSALDATTGAIAAVNGTVTAIKDGNLELDDAGSYEEIADDVVVYLINEDGDFEVSEFKAISKKDEVTLFQLDAADDDKDGFDIIFFIEK